MAEARESEDEMLERKRAKTREWEWRKEDDGIQGSGY